MNATATLPFGQTTTSYEELLDTTDIDAASDIASNFGVTDPKASTDAFLRQVPHLLSWLAEYGRQYPWRDTKDPWKVYLTEILLQRTNGNAVATIYDDVLDRFPSPCSLDRATDEEIQQVVYSLGLVDNRVKTLRSIGTTFCNEYNNNVPDALEKLKEPWGVGNYSARATQLFARDRALALVDANIIRVIERVLDLEMPQQPHKDDDVYRFMEALTPDTPELARAFNLALLDLGALICTPTNPACESCPINECCTYYMKTKLVK
ncbi:hypothetical protein [Haloarchaeobius sp. HME9146]|uniref:hypothetical protein n=1 Tax=Haloarchaeobius sp. HME9146 TaxID=2978732 RepID=UPI0021C0DE31|nr:hypothetical protein [Haloarchaeobius sp. HME9146]MCT9095165.1 hypothetical protein [Haloarchaeobius sp. HME9146]